MLSNSAKCYTFYMGIKDFFRSGSRSELPAGENRLSWTKDALELLSRQDRFTSGQIIDEFAQKSDQRSYITLDDNKFATHVLDDRYVVMWHNDKENVVVDAVIASPFSNNDTTDADIKSGLEARLDFEAKNIKA